MKISGEVHLELNHNFHCRVEIFSQNHLLVTSLFHKPTLWCFTPKFMNYIWGDRD